MFSINTVKFTKLLFRMAGICLFWELFPVDDIETKECALRKKETKERVFYYVTSPCFIFDKLHNVW
jgi:hypothetical protein